MQLINTHIDFKSKLEILGIENEYRSHSSI